MQRRQYTIDEKKAAVARHAKGESIRDIAASIGAARITVHKWVTLARTSGEVSAGKRGRPPGPECMLNRYKRLYYQVKAENVRLVTESATLKQENERLKAQAAST